MTKKKLKVAFPHVGTMYVVWVSLVKAVGGEVIIPPYTSKRTLSLGTKHSPEAICLPYKLILGNFIEAIENGADYVAMITSPGICRLGEYGNNIRETLADLGYKANYIELSLYDGFKGLYRFLVELTGKNNPVQIIRTLNICIRKIFVIDDLDKELSYYRAREIKQDEAEKNYKKALNLVKTADKTSDLKKAYKKGLEIIRSTKIDPNREVLNVDITGEIFLVNDEFSNQNLERELGRMGVQTRRSLTVSSFLKDAIIPKAFRKGETHLERAERLAKPYLMRDIGGDALECISDVAYADERKIDGIIHISPFTCMPEIMSQNIFPAMREECEVPILALIMDEQTGRAGYITRLEAFVDLMRRKKRKGILDAKSEEKQDSKKAEEVTK